VWGGEGGEGGGVNGSRIEYSTVEMWKEQFERDIQIVLLEEQIKALKKRDEKVQNKLIAIKIATGRRNKKETSLKKRLWSRHHSLFWKIMKIKQVCEKPDFWVRELITCREGVSTLQCPPEGDTFNQTRKVDVVFKMLIFPKNNKTRIYKRNKNVFLVFRPDKD